MGISQIVADEISTIKHRLEDLTKPDPEYLPTQTYERRQYVNDTLSLYEWAGTKILKERQNAFKGLFFKNPDTYYDLEKKWKSATHYYGLVLHLYADIVDKKSDVSS